MKFHNLRRLWVALVLVTPALARAAEDKYAVHVFRPSHVGDVEDLDASVSQHLHLVRTVHGRPPVTRDGDWTVHLVGRVTAMAVDDRGVVTRARCEVAKAVTAVDGRTSQLLPAGTVVEVTSPAGTLEYRRPDGGPVTQQARALRQVLSIRPPAAPTPDDLFPAGGPHAVGETWPLDAARSADYDRAAHVPLAKRVTGSATLVKLIEAAGVPCMVLRRTIDTVDEGVPTTQPGATRTLKHSAQIYADTLPLNPAAHGGTFDVSVTNDYVDHGVAADGTPFEAEEHLTIEKRSVLAPVSR